MITEPKEQPARRAALKVAGIGALLAGIPRRASAAEMTAQEKANIQVVNDFCAAWPSHDPSKILAFFADNCAYRMTETMEPAKGRDAVTARITGLLPSVVGFQVLDTWARGPMVVNERIDSFSSGQLKTWHGVGVFFLKDGRIVEWNDYTIEMQRR